MDCEFICSGIYARQKFQIMLERCVGFVYEKNSKLLHMLSGGLWEVLPVEISMRRADFSFPHTSGLYNVPFVLFFR